jgi:transcriptional regulator with XRE-family HTH domain
MQHVAMPESHASRGTRRGRRQLIDLGAELRTARVGAGLSMTAVARAAGISPSELSRIERGLAPWLDIIVASMLCSIVGLDLSLRAFPGGNPLRDSGHARLIAAFRAHLGQGLRVRTQVPVASSPDQRAWVQTLADGEATSATEFETRLYDAQALTRRITLKMRDSGIDRVVVVLADTKANRQAVAAASGVLRPVFPLEASEVLASLREGRVPRAGGIVFLRPLAVVRQQARNTAA